MVPELELTIPEKAIGLLPIVLPILGTILLIMVRIQAGRLRRCSIRMSA